MEARTVLVKLQTLSGLRNRPVTLNNGDKNELLKATKSKFDDILTSDNEIYFQILDESWGDGVYVDLLDQEILPRSILRAVEKVKLS